MISKICTRIRVAPIKDIENVSKNGVSLKEGKSLISVRQKKSSQFNIRSYPTENGYRKDFEMSAILSRSDSNLIYRCKRAAILLLTTTAQEIFVIGSLDFPVKIEFEGDNNISNVIFKQSQPG